MVDVKNQYKKGILLLNGLKSLCIENNLEQKAKYYGNVAERMARGRTIIVVCGEFKRGKSSFINAFLKKPNLCPVDIDITTSLVTQIKYGDNESAQIYYEDELDKDPITIELNEVDQFVTEQNNKCNEKMVKLLDISIPNNFLNDNSLILVDTPGIGTINKRHSEVTYGYLSMADVVLFVSDVLSPLNTNEIDFINRAKKLCPNIMFLLTKTDVSADFEVIEKENIKKLEEYFIEQDIKIFPISSNLMMEYLKTGDTESLEDSNFLTLEEELGRELKGSIRKNILIKPLLEGAQDISMLIRKLSIEMEACDKNNKAKLEEIKNNLLEEQDRLKKYQNINAKWKTILGDIKNDVSHDITVIIKENCNNINEELTVRLKSEKFRNSDMDIKNYINGVVLDMISKINKKINEHVVYLKDRLEMEGGLDIYVPILQVEDINIGKVNSDRYKDQRNTKEKIKDFGRAIGVGGMVVGGLATVATVVSGGTLFPAIVAAVGPEVVGTVLTAAGACIGAGEYERSNNSREFSDAIAYFNKYIQNVQSDINLQMRKREEDIFRNIRDNINDAIKQSIELTEKTIKEISDNTKLGEKESKEKISELALKLGKAKTLKDKTLELIEQVAEQ